MEREQNALTNNEVAADIPSRDEVLRQLEHLLASSFFSNSKRCQAMLRHVVTRTVDGAADDLKERSLGIDVYQRPVDYDTNVDPVVRLAAGDIRKRLAQYYCEPEHESELRISLPSGSYVPEFHRPDTDRAAQPQATEIAGANMLAIIAHLHRFFRRSILLGAILLLLAAAVAFVLVHFLGRSPLDVFWGPIRDARAPVLICVGQPTHALGETVFKQIEAQNSLAVHTLWSDTITTADAMAASRISGELSKLDIPYSLQGADSTSFSDMRKGSAVLVSGADNPWTMRAIGNLRFSFNGERVGNFARVWIADRKNPAQHAWAVDFSGPYTALSQDYALVGRFSDPSTGQLAVVAAGISANGTTSAAECISDSKCLKAIIARDPAKGHTSNIEAVIGTQVIDGKSGPPVVLAVQSW